MAVNDIRSNLISQFMGSITVAADATTPFAGVMDGAAFELGNMFSIQVTTAGTATSTTLVIQESDDETFATFTTLVPITDDEVIGSGVIDITALSVVPDADPLTIENRLVTLGVFSNLRYLRPAIVDVGGNGAGIVSCFVVQKAENMPTVEPEA